MEQEQITLTLDREQYPQVLKRYGLEGAKQLAISMALKQYRERPLTEAMLYSCLSMMEIDLERLYPPAKTPEEQAEEDAEAAEEEREYQEAIAEMEPYLVKGTQAMVDVNGEFPSPMDHPGDLFPVWRDRNGDLTARVYQEGWDWLILEDPEAGEDEEAD